MFAAGIATLVRTVMEKPINTNFPLVQLILGSLGLCSMVGYVILRQRIMSKRESQKRVGRTAYQVPNLREWLGGHHGATSHAGSSK